MNEWAPRTVTGCRGARAAAPEQYMCLLCKIPHLSENVCSCTRRGNHAAPLIPPWLRNGVQLSMHRDGKVIVEDQGPRRASPGSLGGLGWTHCFAAPPPASFLPCIFCGASHVVRPAHTNGVHGYFVLGPVAIFIGPSLYSNRLFSSSPAGAIFRPRSYISRIHGCHCLHLHLFIYHPSNEDKGGLVAW